MVFKCTPYVENVYRSSFFKPMCINIEYLWFILGQFFSSHFCILYYSLFVLSFRLFCTGLTDSLITNYTRLECDFTDSSRSSCNMHSMAAWIKSFLAPGDMFPSLRCLLIYVLSVCTLEIIVFSLKSFFFSLNKV